MGFKVLNLCVSALFLCLLKAGSIRAQCTQPSFESKNVMLISDYLLTRSFADGSTVTFECIIGHKPVDSKASRSVTCKGNQWTNLDFSCTKKLCGPLLDIIFGKYVMTGINFGDTATPVCNKGYMLAGQGTPRTCRDQGWDGRDPLCEPVKCLNLPAIENGQLLDVPLESYDYLQEVSYRCNRGFNLIGESTLYCSEDGTFKPDPPICFDGCPTPNIPNAKRIVGRSPPYKLNHFLEYKCVDGYTMKGESHILCTKNGWSPEPPQCTNGCPTPNISNAKRIGGKSPPYKLNNFLEYKCDDGYKMKGESYIVCKINGWSPEPPQCIAAKCQAPPVIENGQIEAVFYKCNNGFVLQGRSSLYCSEDGTFKEDPPKCLEGSVCDGICLRKKMHDNNPV